jgi:hypothetical protein
MRFRQSFGAGILALVILGAGCRSTFDVPSTHEIVAPLPTPEWQDVGDGVMRLEVEFGKLAVKGSLRMYRFPKEGWSWGFAQSTSAASVRDWSDRIPDATVIINGVYFHDDNLPSGTFVSHGERVGSRAFDADKSALIVLAPTPRIVDLTTEPSALDHATEAAQTFPYLIKDGVSAITEDSGKLAERTFVGTDKEGRWYVGVALNESLSLYELMQLVAAQPVVWDDVTNLDGGPSTGIFIDLPNENRSRNSLAPVSNVIVGRRKS